MQHSPPQQQSIPKSSRSPVEEALAILGLVKRGWRLIAVAVAICLTASVITLVRTKTVYKSSARLLVLQQGGRPLSVTSSGDPFQHLQTQDSLATHLMIIRSPAIVERAIALTGLAQISVESVIDRLKVTQPAENAKVLELAFQADTSDEAMALMKAIVASYDRFLKDNYQKDTREVISLIVKARDDLSKELKQLEQEYLEFRQKSPSYSADRDGRTFLARRVDQWDQAANQAISRSLQLKAQLALAKRLTSEGSGHHFITAAINQLSGGGATTVPPTDDGSKEDGAGASYERIIAQLADVVFQRRHAERLLQQIKVEYDAAEARRSPDDPEVIREFYDMTDVARLQEKLQEERRRRDMNARIPRDDNDPSLVSHATRIKALETQIDGLWQRMQPQLLEPRRDLARLDSIRKYEEELIVLKARETTLGERATELRAEQLQKLKSDRDELARLGDQSAEKLAELDRQIQRLEQVGQAATALQGDRRNLTLIDTLERSLESIETMRGQIQKLFDDDLSASKKAEITQLAEANLRSNLERQRTLFDSVASQLKQAQLVSDFGSVTAQTISPPSLTPIRPRVFTMLALGLLAGCGLGGGVAYLVDLLEAKVRTMSELKSILELPVIAVVPQLTADQVAESTHIALLSHHSPRSFLAESYKSARTNIEFLRRNRRAQVLLISSPNPGDGKSTTSSNLAITLALAGRKVLLIDGDLRKPSLHAIYGLSRERGLVSILQGEDPFDRAVQPTAIENLDLLATGPEAANPAELLASDLLAQVLEQIRPIYDIIIFDTSPLLAVTDPWIISAVADGILLVVRLGGTRRHDIEQTMEVLKTLDAPILGMIVNGVMRENLGYGYGYGYGYGHGYGYGYGYGQSRENPQSAINAATPARSVAAERNGHGEIANGLLDQ